MSNIKFTNGVQLDQSSVYGVTGIDVSNIMASNIQSYTAVEDCWVLFQSGYVYDNQIKLDGSYIFTSAGADSPKPASVIGLRKGQTFKTDNNQHNFKAWIYGLKK